MFLKVNDLVKKITSDHVFVYGFYAFLTFGLLLGDGKQALIDTFASVAILSLHIFSRYYLVKQRTLPKHLLYLFMLNLGFFLYRTIVSDSIGYSVTTSMRLLMMFLTFTLFYEYVNEKSKKIFINGLFLFSTVAIVVSTGFILYPKATLILPLMNLLYANYGHNNLSNLLVIIYPLSLVGLLRIQRKNKYNFIRIMYFLLILISLILTFSRAALFLLGLYTIFQIGLNYREYPRKKSLLLLVLGIFSTFSIVVFSTLSIKQSQLSTLPRGWLQRQINKPLLKEDGRLQYWKQAINGFKEQPLLGNGPGTFYITSKRFQTAPNQYSWFAHNSMLESLSEVGIIGSSLLLTLMFFISREVLFNSKNSQKEEYFFPLCGSIILSIFVSFFDFNLHFLVISLLLASIGGYLTSKHDTLVLQDHWFSKICLFLLSIYYLVSLSILLPLPIPSHTFFANIIFTSSVNKHIQNTKYQFTENEVKLITAIHSKNSEILISLCKKLSSNKQTNDLITICIDAYRSDPTNKIALVNTFEAIKLYGTLNDLLMFLKEILIHNDIHLDLSKLYDHPENTLLVQQYLNNLNVVDQTSEEFLSQLLYLVGCMVKDTNHDTTINLWKQARDLSSNWGYYHVELASLYYANHDYDTSKEILKQCATNRYAQELCSIYLKDFQDITEPGEFRKNIEAIPTILVDEYYESTE